MAKTRTTSSVVQGGRAKSARSAAPKAARSLVPPAAQSAIVNPGADFDAANLAAVAQANTALIEGFEAIGEAVCAYARQSFNSATSTARSMIDARNLVDVVALNRDFTQTTLGGLLANSVRVSEIGIRATSEVLKPLGKRVADTISKMSRPSNL